MSALADPTWTNWLTGEKLASLIRVFLLVAVGIPALVLLGRLVDRLVRQHVTLQAGMLIRKGIVYFGTAVIFITVLHELGFELTALLGAAGIVGVAVGFAAQTSLSNLISGLFLIWESPFQVGDILTIGQTTGIVHSIDLLSVKLRTFDNQFVRIPNESLIKTQFTNITRFPIRRLDLNIGVAYKEDIAKVMKALSEVADRNPYCLDEPAPIIVFLGFGESALQFLFGVWFAKADVLILRNSIYKEIKERFDADGIEIPFPHRTLYTGAATDPFPVRVVPEETASGGTATERHA